MSLLRIHKGKLLLASPRAGARPYCLNRFSTAQPLSNGATPELKFVKSRAGLQRPHSSVAIFWDWENCALPFDAVAPRLSMVYQLARSLGQKITFKVYMDSAHVLASAGGTTVRSRLSSAGLELIDCPHDGKKEVVDKAIIVDVMQYALDNPPPSSLVLISGDRDYAQMLSKLTLRGYHVVVVAPAVTITQDGLRLAQYNEMYEWSDRLLPLSGQDSVRPRSPAGSSEAQVQKGGPIVKQPLPHNLNGKKLHAETGFFSSAAKPSATTEMQQASESKVTKQKVKPSQSNSESPPKSSTVLIRAVEAKFHPLVNVLWSKRSEGIRYLSFSELGALLKKDVYQKAGVTRVKKYATLAHKDRVIVFSADKSGSDAGVQTGDFVGLHPRLSRVSASE